MSRDIFFREWLDRQVIFIEDWPYAGIDFRGDPDMPLPVGEQWDDGGKTLDLFLIFIFCNVFEFFHVHVLINSMMCRCGTDETPWLGPGGAEGCTGH